jgi:hypothetical protein
MPTPPGAATLESHNNAPGSTRCSGSWLINGCSLVEADGPSI